MIIIIIIIILLLLLLLLLLTPHPRVSWQAIGGDVLVVAGAATMTGFWWFSFNLFIETRVAGGLHTVLLGSYSSIGGGAVSAGASAGQFGIGTVYYCMAGVFNLIGSTLIGYVVAYARMGCGAMSLSEFESF
jgi:hypothetical protein